MTPTIGTTRDLTDLLLRSPNVVGFGHAVKKRFGRSTGRHSVVVFVREKLPADRVPAADLVPPTVRTLAGPMVTDVVQLEAVSAAAPTRTRVRPAPSGVSLGVANGPLATLGCLVKDQADGSVAILGTAGALANGGGANGTKVYQPAPLGTPDPNDLIGTVTRSTQLALYPALYPPPTGQGPSPVDAALVKPTSPSLVIDQVLNRTMPTATPTHPLMGVITGFETDPDGAFVAVAAPATDMLTKLNATTLRPNSTLQPTLGKDAFVTGATYGRRVGSVSAVAVTYKVHYQTQSGPKLGLMSGSFLVELDYGAVDDVGAAVFAFAGNQVDSQCGGCSLAANLERTYGIPLTQDVDLADRLRDDYLLKTTTGRLLVQLFYKNQPTLVARIGSANPTKAELDYARKLYEKYETRARAEAEHVSWTIVPVTADLMDEARAATYGLSRFMTDAEYDAAQKLVDIVGEVQDMTLADAMTYMDQTSVRDRVLALIQPLPGWDTSYDAS